MTDPREIATSRSVARPMADTLRHGRLVAERDAILAVIPHDPSVAIRAAELQRSRLRAEREELATGTGRYRDHPVAQALRDLRLAESNVARLERNLGGRGPSGKERRAWRRELDQWRPRLAMASRDVADLTATELARLDTDDQRLETRLSGLWKQRQQHQSSALRHPEAEARLGYLTVEIASLDEALDRKPPALELPPSLQPERWAQLALRSSAAGSISAGSPPAGTSTSHDVGRGIPLIRTGYDSAQPPARGRFPGTSRVSLPTHAELRRSSAVILGARSGTRGRGR